MPVWLQDLLPEGLTAAEVTAALVGIGVILLLLAALRRRWSSRGPSIRGAVASRVSVVEWSVVDERRRLVLVRRDDVEHLVMIGGPSDVVIEANIGSRQLSQATERSAAPRAPAIAARPAAAAQNAAAIATLEQAALAYAPASPVEPRKVAALPEPAAETPEPRAAEQSQKTLTPKARPPLAAVPLSANAAQPVGGSTPEGTRRNGLASADHGRSGQAAAEAERSSAARRQATPTRKEPNVAASTSRWAGTGQGAAVVVGEAAKQSKRLGNGLAEAANDQKGWAGHNDIEEEIVRALSIDPFPPLAFPAASGNASRATEPMLKTAGSATAATGTLGDLAEKLEEALAYEVRASSPGRPRLDLDLDAFTGTDRVQPAVSAAPSRATPAPRPVEVETRRETPAPVAATEDPPVISLSSRRRDMGDPIEDEMARLLGELTDGARR